MSRPTSRTARPRWQAEIRPAVRPLVARAPSERIDVAAWVSDPPASVPQAVVSTCGSALFWDPIGRDTIAVGMEAFEPPTGTKLRIHIYVADKGDYYDIGDGLAQNQQ